jgi:hypothetical protein
VGKLEAKRTPERPRRKGEDNTIKYLLEIVRGCGLTWFRNMC